MRKKAVVMNLRFETLADRGRIATLIARTYGKEGASVIEITGKLREENGYADGYGIVSVGDDIDAYVLFTPLKVNGKISSAALLAPFAVDTSLPHFDADQFVQMASEKIAAKGIRYILLLGQLDELNSEQYKTAELAGLKLAPGVASQNVLVRDLGEQYGPAVDGDIHFPLCLLD